MKVHLITSFMALGCAAAATSSHGAILLAWEMTNSGAASVTPTTVNALVTSQDVLRGAGLFAPGGGTTGWRLRDFDTATTAPASTGLDAALAANEYISMTIDPTTDDLSLTELAISMDGREAAVYTLGVYSSHDSFASLVDTPQTFDAGVAGFELMTFDLSSIPDVTVGSPLEIRVAFTTTGDTTKDFFVTSIGPDTAGDDLVISGDLAAIPEPGVMGYFVFSAALLLMGVRRR